MKRWLAAWGLMCAAMGAVQAAEYVVDPSTARDRLARLKAGDTLVLKAGVYRMTLDLRNRHGEADRPIVIRSESPTARAVLKGSDVLTGWTDLGGGMYSHGLSVQPSMVFVDGKRLAQMGGTIFNGYPVLGNTGYESLHANDGGVWPGRVSSFDRDNLPLNSFYYDALASRVVVRVNADLNAAGRVVEVSQRERVVFAENVRYLTVQDVDVVHANTSVTNRGGALTLLGQHITVKGVKAYYNDLVGLQVDGDYNVIEDSVSTYNGQMGVAARGSNNLLQRVESTYNNIRGFNTWWEAGGFKFVSESGGLQNSKLIDCKAIANQGDGIWFDWKNKGNLVRGAVAAYNKGFGIHYEASSQATIESNYVFGNGLRGIYLPHSRGNVVVHNLVVGNALEGMVAVSEGRKDNEGRPFEVDGNVFAANVVAWNGSGSLIVPPKVRSVADGNVYVGQGIAQRFSLGWTSMLNLPVHGVSEWRRLSGLDAHSVSRTDAMPAGIRRLLDSRSVDVTQFAELLALARRDMAAQPGGWGTGDLLAVPQLYVPGPVDQ